MIKLARRQPVSGERDGSGKPVSWTPKTLPEVAGRHELPSVKPPAIRASVSPFAKIAAAGSLGAAGSTRVTLEGEVCLAGQLPLQGGEGLLAWLPHSCPSPTAPPFLSFTPSSPGAASQQKESLGSNDEDGCVIDSAPPSLCPSGRKLKDHLLRGESPQVHPEARQFVSVKRMLL